MAEEMRGTQRMEGERGETRGRGVRDGVTNKRKQSVEHERPQDFGYRGRKEFTWILEKETEK